MTYGTRTSLTTSAHNSLANSTYVVLGTLNNSANNPYDVHIEFTCTPGTVSGNKRVRLFAQLSLDGTNFESGPASGSTTTDEPNLHLIGDLPCNTSSAAQTRVFSLAAALGCTPFRSVKLIAKNETGAALSGSGNSVYYQELT
ncbi:hypothetical protein [Methylomagnum ishizawai]|uniref:hypothetical protein n=1 Tax=Methylomagnum ishizawai TaxID=1760988 RepID=UPI001C326A8C|nr:hypothetical protein [Methylomagnum ishizawai]BBL75571.1 hypothetical protein MishRS11D_26690 [Methylomagnum ishizawai]